MTETMKEIGRIIAGAYYDYQDIRISTMNRIRDIIRKKSEDISFNEVEKKKENKTSKKYTDKKLFEMLNKLLKDKKINEKEYEYINKILDISKSSLVLENKYKTYMMKYIQSEPIYNEFLSKVKGIGVVLSANLIKNFGYCERFEMVSSLWKYCGLHVKDGQAVKRKRGEKVDYNPKMKTLAWKIGDSLIKSNSPFYKDVYNSAKERELNREDENKPKNKLHAHYRAMRKMVKLFLSHYWACGRELKGLDTREPYVFEKLGHKHKVTWKEVVGKS